MIFCRRRCRRCRRSTYLTYKMTSNESSLVVSSTSNSANQIALVATQEESTEMVPYDDALERALSDVLSEAPSTVKTQQTSSSVLRQRLATAHAAQRAQALAAVARADAIAERARLQAVILEQEHQEQMLQCEIESRGSQRSRSTLGRFKPTMSTKDIILSVNNKFHRRRHLLLQL